jgi:hypothetical protein
MPVKWHPKRHKTVETRSYGSELVATCIEIELIIELRYKLRMLGVQVEGPTTTYGDNMAVVLNTTVPSSLLKKKHNAIAYHRVREAIAGKIVRLAHIPSEENIADILTKTLPIKAFQTLASQVYFVKFPPPRPVSQYPVSCAQVVSLPGSRGGDIGANSTINGKRGTTTTSLETLLKDTTKRVSDDTKPP